MEFLRRLGNFVPVMSRTAWFSSKSLEVSHEQKAAVKLRVVKVLALGLMLFSPEGGRWRRAGVGKRWQSRGLGSHAGQAMNAGRMCAWRCYVPTNPPTQTAVSLSTTATWFLSHV